MRLKLLAPILFMTMLAMASAAHADAPATYIVLPTEAFAPDIAVDATGVVHVVYVTAEKNGYYIRSADKGKTFSPRVKINGSESVEYRMGERGPKLALGAKGAIHLSWQDAWSPGVKGKARYARSLDGGKTFEPPQGVSSMTGVDGVTLTADAKGNVVFFWHVDEPKQDKIKQATWLWTTSSNDNGTTFRPNAAVKVSNGSALACSMCMLNARIAADGDVLLIFRTADKNIRDHWVLKAKPGADTFMATRVNNDNWEIPTCPMCGPVMTISPKGLVVAAYMSRHKVYWSVADEKLKAFKLHAGTPELYKNSNDEIYASAAMNTKGEVLMVWQNGPMSTTGKASVRWATYKPDGTPDGNTGTIGTTTSGTKACVTVGADDAFYVVTTAK